MKPLKTLILSLILASCLTPSLAVFAQETPVTQTQIQELQSTLVALLTQLIAELQKQITELVAQQSVLVAQQASTSQVVNNLQSAPVLGVVTQTPSGPTVILGEPYCNPGDANKQTAYIPLVISGSNWKYGSATADPVSLPVGWDAFKQGGARFEAASNPKRISVGNGWGTTTISVSLGNEKKYWNDLEPIPTYTFTNTVVVGDLCN